MIRYFWPSDDEQLAGQFIDSHFDEDGGWWAGLQRAGAVFAIAATLALSAASTTVASTVFSQHQDDPFLVAVQPDLPEEYWQNPVAPVVWPQPSVITADDTFLTYIQINTIDEDFWQNGVAPVPATNYVKLPFLDPEELSQFPAATNHLDDSALWVPQLNPFDYDWNVLFFLDDGSWVPAMEPDEDFWAPQIPSQLWAPPAQPFRASDDTDFPRPLQMDELYWQNSTAPVPAANALLQQFPFEQNEPAGTLRTQIDEDYWQNSTAPVVWAQPSVITDDIIVQTFVAAFQIDEDFWMNPVAPVPATNLVSLPFTVEDPIHPSVTGAVPDEVFWIPDIPLQQRYAAWTTPPIYYTYNVEHFDEVFYSNALPPFVPPVVTPGSLVGLFGYNRNV